MKMYVETAIIHKIFKHLVIVRKMFLWKLQSTRCDSNTLFPAELWIQLRAGGGEMQQCFRCPYCDLQQTPCR